MMILVISLLISLILNIVVLRFCCFNSKKLVDRYKKRTDEFYNLRKEVDLKDQEIFSKNEKHKIEIFNFIKILKSNANYTIDDIESGAEFFLTKRYPRIIVKKNDLYASMVLDSKEKSLQTTSSGWISKEKLFEYIICHGYLKEGNINELKNIQKLKKLEEFELDLEL